MKKIILLPLLFLSLSSANISAENFFRLKENQLVNRADSLKKSPAVKDTASIKKKKEILLPMKIKRLSSNEFKSDFISEEDIRTTDYRTVVDYFSGAAFSFINDFGSLGYPNEMFLYGTGNGNIEVLSDGIPVNSRLSNSFALNLFQSESINSAEIISPTRGFLFSTLNNAVSLNLISRDPDIRKPYSRLRYYQAANSEAQLDGIFSFNPANRLNAYLEISNHGTRPNYANTDYSNWSLTSRLRYLFSKSINLTGSYRYTKSDIQLNGGIDADSIRRKYDPSQYTEILYDNFRAPVNYSDRYKKSTINDLRLRLLMDYSEKVRSDLTFYYQSVLEEFRQNELASASESILKKIVDDNSESVLGGSLRQNFNWGIAEINSITNFERAKFISPLLPEDIIKSSFSEALSASLDISNDMIKPSLFGKYLSYSGNNYIGFGGDLFLRPEKNITVYAGISTYSKPRSVWEERIIVPGINDEQEKISSAELTVAFENESLLASLNYFHRVNSNALISTTYTDYPKADRSWYFAKRDLNLSGLNLRFDFRYWKLHLNTNNSLYFTSSNRKEFKLPEYSSSGGIYYIDSLFDGNLHLKTGLNYYAIGKRDFIYYDFERNISSGFNSNPFLLPGSTNPSLSSTFQIDFFMAGKIRTDATIYFVFENLLNAQYYIIPYYPKQARGMRFGVAWEFLD